MFLLIDIDPRNNAREIDGGRNAINRNDKTPFFRWNFKIKIQYTVFLSLSAQKLHPLFFLSVEASSCEDSMGKIKAFKEEFSLGLLILL